MGLVFKHPEAGEMVGDYRIVKKIGSGGFSTVFQAERAGLFFAVKMLWSGELGARQRREFGMLESALTLGEVHLQGVFHRDLKPGNIIIEGESERPVLIDFGVGTYVEVQISPEQPTTFLFDSDVREDGLTLEDRERFAVAPGRRILTIVPSERVRGEKPSILTVCFADGAAPACVTFRLVVHPAIGERQVEIFRHQRTVDSIQTELKKTREENARLRAENERLRTERDRPGGLTGLFASGMMGEGGIPSQDSTEHITRRKSNTLRLVLDATFWPAEPIPSGERRRVWLEVMAPDSQTKGTFILKMWEVDGQRTFILGNVTFSALAEKPRL